MSLRKDIRHISKTCAYCGKDLLKFEDKTADHIKPKSKGGKTKISNLVCCCKECNNKKKDTDISEWLSDNEIKRNFIKYLFRMKGFRKGYINAVFTKIREVI